MRKYFISFVLLLAFGFAFEPAHALSAEDRKKIDKQIEDYFLRNPEKLEQALENMQAFIEDRSNRLQAVALVQNADKLYRDEADYTMGPKNAPITIVEFFDYNCGYCKRSFAPLMEVLKENTDVRLVFKEYPILGKPSYLASSTALAINDRMKYLTYHSKLMTHSGQVSQAVVEKILGELDLPPQKLQTDARSDKYVLQLAKTRELADAIGVNGTPAFVINGQLFPGALNKAELTQAIKFARAELKAK